MHYLAAMGSRPRGHVHEALRRATSAAHHVLDHHPVLHRLTAGDLTLDQYAESLAAMYRPHARLERLVLQSRHHVESGLGLRERLGRLEADLLDLGRPAVAGAPASRTDPPDDRGTWWGRVYVLEGSRLGSAVIGRCVRSTLGENVPRRFLDEGVPSSWSGLLALLESGLEHDDDLERAVASAVAAFDDYKVALDAFEGAGCDIQMM